MADDLAPPPPLREIARPALFLDFDGTLVDLAETPGGIAVPDRLAGALEAKARELDGRLALVSGRFLDDVRQYLPGCGIVMAGSHGAEIASPQGSPVAERAAPPLPEAALAAARDYAAQTSGLLLEEKALGIGLHFRGHAERADAVHAFARGLAREHGLTLKTGKMVVELATSDTNKGDGVRAIMRHPPFAGALPVFVGDDTTDEDGFAAASALGGFGVLVGEERETRARFRLLDVAAVHEWLELR